MADELKTLSIDIDCGEVDSVEKWQALQDEAFAKILFERIKHANSCGLFRKQDLDGIFEVCKNDAKVFHKFRIMVTQQFMLPHEAELKKKEKHDGAPFELEVPDLHPCPQLHPIVRDRDDHDPCPEPASVVCRDPHRAALDRPHVRLRAAQASVHQALRLTREYSATLNWLTIIKQQKNIREAHRSSGDRTRVS